MSPVRPLRRCGKGPSAGSARSDASRLVCAPLQCLRGVPERADQAMNVDVGDQAGAICALQEVALAASARNRTHGAIGQVCVHPRHGTHTSTRGTSSCAVRVKRCIYRRPADPPVWRRGRELCSRRSCQLNSSCVVTVSQSESMGHPGHHAFRVDPLGGPASQPIPGT